MNPQPTLKLPTNRGEAIKAVKQICVQWEIPLSSPSILAELLGQQICTLRLSLKELEIQLAKSMEQIELLNNQIRNLL